MALQGVMLVLGASALGLAVAWWRGHVDWLPMLGLLILTNMSLVVVGILASYPWWGVAPNAVGAVAMTLWFVLDAARGDRSDPIDNAGTDV